MTNIKEFHLYYDSTIEPFTSITGSIEYILRKLHKLSNKGYKIKIIDTAGWTNDMLFEIYMSVVQLAIRRKFRLRKVFGTAREGGKYFGKEVASLLVYENDQLVDVYPKIEKGRLITIEDYLKSII